MHAGRLGASLRERFPQGTGSLLSLLARVPSRVLASLALCLASDFVRDRPLSLSLWSPRRVTSEALLGSSRAWSGSASCCQGLAEGEASLARSVSLDTCPLALPAPFVSGLFSGRVKLGASFWPSFSLLSLNLLTGAMVWLNGALVSSKKKLPMDRCRRAAHQGLAGDISGTTEYFCFPSQSAPCRRRRWRSTWGAI